VHSAPGNLEKMVEDVQSSRDVQECRRIGHTKSV
jgi:hypothetical protein